MQYRNVGGSGLKVSEIALGSWMTRLADAAAVDIAMDIAHKAFDAGVNFFDCADAYSGGDAEVFLGRFIKDLQMCIRDRCRRTGAASLNG